MSWDAKAAEAVRAHLSVAVLVVDGGGKVSDANPAGASLFGGAAEGRDLADALSEKDRQRAAELLGQTRSGGQVIAFAARSALGKEVTCSLVPAGGEDGRVAVLVRDVTSASQLAASEARQRLLLSRTTDFVFAQDLDLRYTHVAGAPAGLDPAAMIGKIDEDLLPGEEVELLDTIKRLVLTGGNLEERDVRLSFGAEREPRFYRLLLLPWRELTGKVSGVIGFARDVTRARQAEEERDRASRELAKKEAQLAAATRALEDARRSAAVVIARATHALESVGAEHAAAPSMAEVIELARRLAASAEGLGSRPGAGLSIERSRPGSVSGLGAPQPAPGAPPPSGEVPLFGGWPVPPPMGVLPFGPPPITGEIPPFAVRSAVAGAAPPFGPPPITGEVLLQPGAPPPPDPAAIEALKGDGIVLVADADQETRTGVGRALLQFGYRVLFASSAQNALDTLAKHSRVIRAVVVDTELPGAGAPGLFEQMLAVKPDLGLVVSSRTDAAARRVESSGVAQARAIQKPYEAIRLAEKLKESAGAIGAAVG